MSVTVDQIRRWQARLGKFEADEWELFLARLSIPWVEMPLPTTVPAFTLNRVIFLDRDLSNHEKAYWAWHEAAHLLMHVGSCTWWSSRPQGHITVRKFEWQAQQFALLYPDWE